MSPPPDVLARLSAIWPAARLRRRKEARRLPAAPGAYALIFSLPGPLEIGSGRFRGARLAAGWYAYAGSARGPGGLRARLSRHMRKRKKRRWHIDWLTAQREEIFALCFPGGDECALAAALREAGASAPLPGFGASDCAACASHLFFLGPPEPRACGRDKP